jgi:hypothetical protein
MLEQVETHLRVVVPIEEEEEDVAQTARYVVKKLVCCSGTE